ncbi:MAG: cytochrome c [Candidatus Methylomirabilales bacterium]
MKEPWWALGFLLLSGFLIGAQATAGAIDERRALMRAIAGELQQIWEGLAQQDLVVVEKGAHRIAAQAVRFPTLFPPESFHAPSRAQPAIRKEFRTFETLAVNLKESAQEVELSARNGRVAEVRAHLDRLVQTCRQCHRSFIRPY